MWLCTALWLFLLIGLARSFRRWRPMILFMTMLQCSILPPRKPVRAHHRFQTLAFHHHRHRLNFYRFRPSMTPVKISVILANFYDFIPRSISRMMGLRKACLLIIWRSPRVLFFALCSFRSRAYVDYCIFEGKFHSEHSPLRTYDPGTMNNIFWSLQFLICFWFAEKRSVGSYSVKSIRRTAAQAHRPRSTQLFRDWCQQTRLLTVSSYHRLHMASSNHARWITSK